MRALVARAGAIVSAAILLYIAYAHIAEWRTASEYLEDPIAVRFAGPEAASDPALRREGPIDAKVEAGALRVTAAGTAGGPPPAVEFACPPRRLREAEIRLRFRLHAVSDVDVGVALVRDDGVQARVGFGVRGDGDRSTYRFFGDERADMPRAGDEFGMQRLVRFERPDEVHTVALRVSPDLHAVLGSVDGQPVSSHLAGWDDGVLVRPSFFVRSRSPHELVDVEIAQMDYLPIPRDTRRRDIEERFDGQVLDPVLWRVMHADGWFADGSLQLVKGRGLELTGHALRRTREVEALGLVGPSQALGSFRATMRFGANRLRHARVYLGISNLLFGLSDWRTFEVGLTGGPVQFEPFAAGHWEGDQQFTVAELPWASVDAASGELGIDYDAHTGVAIGTLNGRVIARQRLDLQPPEEVRLQMGVRLMDEDGDFDVTLRDVRFETRPWTAGESSLQATAPGDAGDRTFLDDFTDPSGLSKYRTLRGAARIVGGSGLELGLDAPTGPADYQVVRGFFDAPVSVTATIAVPPDPVRGADDSAGVMALDRTGTTRYLALLWYGSLFEPSLHLSRETQAGSEVLAVAPAPMAPGKSYSVRLLVDRRNVYARYWQTGGRDGEPSTWIVSAPIEEGWTATGGVGVAGHAGRARVTSLQAE